MRNLFSMDNPVFRALGKLADLMMLNIIFIISCIPIITIGAAVTGLYYVTLKMAENEEGYLFKSYWKSFRQNFKQATVIWIIMLLAGCILGIDFYILGQTTSSAMSVLRIVISATALLYAMVLIYVFPTLARFYNSTITTLRNAFLMALANLPYTMLMLIITVGSVIITFLNAYTLWYGLLVWILAGFALVAYANSYFLKKVLAKYMPKEEETNPDEWTVEEPEKESVEANIIAEDSSEAKN